MMLMLKIMCFLPALTLAIGDHYDKDILVCEANKMGSKKPMDEHFPIDDHFRYEGLKKSPAKSGARTQSGRSDVYYVVPSSQRQKPRQQKRPLSDYALDMIKDYPNHEQNHNHGEFLTDMMFSDTAKPNFPPMDEPKFQDFEPKDHKFGKSRKLETISHKLDTDDRKYKLELDEPKFEPHDQRFSKFDPEEHNYGGKYDHNEHRYGEDEYKFDGKFEEADHNYGGKFVQEEHKFGSKIEPIGDAKYSKNVYIGEEPCCEKEGKQKDDLGQYEHYEPYEPKRRQPARPTFLRSSARDEPKSRHQDRYHDFRYYTQESSESRKSKRPSPPPPRSPHNEEFEESCDCDCEDCDCE